MSLWLNFGAGKNLLPEPWQNLNAEHDIRKPLRFADKSAQCVLAEHVIEHVPFVQGMFFLSEVWRILKPGGVLRLAFPDVGRLLAMGVEIQQRTHRFELGDNAQRYASLLADRPESLVRESKLTPDSTKMNAALTLLLGWQHESTWTEFSAAGALLATGFSTVLARRYGAGELGEFDGHHKAVGQPLAELETTILEAAK